jgi:serine/threonine-protein kinase PknG
VPVLVTPAAHTANGAGTPAPAPRTPTASIAPDVSGRADPPGAANPPAVLSDAARAVLDAAARSAPTAPHRGGPGRPWETAVVIETVPARDPQAVVLHDTVVPEHARFCGQTRCGEPVGRAHDGGPGRVSGYCWSCGTRYRFEPPLPPGTLLGGRYRIEGCLGRGGVGWVFLARDEDLNGSWRVLKGQRNPLDPAAAEAFAAEREALITLNHPNIVQISHVVRSPTGDGSYLVMDYVDGGTLEDIRAAAGPAGEPAAIDAAEVLRYGEATLDAFGYLHEQGWRYCDLKPENVMLTGPWLKIIDFGAARQATNRLGRPWGTAGFEAPEIAELGPDGVSVQSDLYTVGRTLAALALATSTAEFALSFPPGVDMLITPVPAALDPFLRLIDRATRHEPAERFATATHMLEQVRGVRRQVRSARDNVPRPAHSLRFSPPTRAFADHVDADRLDPVEIALGLPTPLVAAADPAAGFLGSIGPAEPAELIAILDAAPTQTPEVTFLAVRTELAAGRAARATERLGMLAAGVAAWRRHWHEGLVALAAKQYAAARSAFEEVYGRLPGELAARLGFAVACELAGDPVTAAGHYECVWRTDRALAAAVFGLARGRLAAGQWRAAADVLAAAGVADGAPVATAAGTCAVEIRLVTPAGRTGEDLARAGRIAASLRLTGRERHEVDIRVLHAARCWPRAARSGVDRILGVPLTQAELGRALERAYRSLARFAGSRAERIALVDLANANRPGSWL